jgi:hypothetical protein
MHHEDGVRHELDGVEDGDDLGENNGVNGGCSQVRKERHDKLGSTVSGEEEVLNGRLEGRRGGSGGVRARIVEEKTGTLGWDEGLNHGLKRLIITMSSTTGTK